MSAKYFHGNHSKFTKNAIQTPRWNRQADMPVPYPAQGLFPHNPGKGEIILIPTGNAQWPGLGYLELHH